MAVTIQLKFLRHSAKKLRPLARLVKGQSLEKAIANTSVMSQDSARFLHRGLLMARAAATDKAFVPEQLTVTEVFATEGPRLKRIRANARGRASRYQKHLAHLTVRVAETSTAKKVRQTKSKETNGSEN